MDLVTEYLGLRLANPLVAGASPLSHSLAGIEHLAECGVGAIVLHSLFEEEVEHESSRLARLARQASESQPEARSYFPAGEPELSAPRSYLSLLERAAGSVKVPVLASLNGVSAGGWTRYAHQMQEAGAAAIELNLYSSPAGPTVSGRELEHRHAEIVGLVRSATSVPISVKLSPYYSSVGEMAARFVAAGAGGLVLFNRFLHPDVDHYTLQVVPGIGLSNSHEGRLARSWIALLRNRLRVDLAASSGVDGSDDLARFLLAGADVVQSVSALLRYGPEHARTLLAGLTEWMERKGFSSLQVLRGLLAVPGGDDEADQERAGYVAALRAANGAGHGPW